MTPTTNRKTQYLAFTLSMPGRGSWNGGWSGEGDLYVIVRPFSTQKSKEVAARILSRGHYSYRWSDGWRASIEVKEVDSQEARRLKRKSKGFCGYDWMVGSIIQHDKIRVNS